MFKVWRDHNDDGSIDRSGKVYDKVTGPNALPRGIQNLREAISLWINRERPRGLFSHSCFRPRGARNQ